MEWKKHCNKMAFGFFVLLVVAQTIFTKGSMVMRSLINLGLDLMVQDTKRVYRLLTARVGPEGQLRVGLVGCLHAVYCKNEMTLSGVGGGGISSYTMIDTKQAGIDIPV